MKRLISIFQATVIAIGAVTLLSSSPAQARAVAQDTTFRVAVETEPVTFDPNKEGRGASAFYQWYIYQGLLHPGSMDWDFKPNLAVSWEVLSPTAWKFVLRRDVSFHQGQPFTARDVQFSIYRQMGRYDPAFPGSAKKTWQKIIKKVEVLDDYTLIIHTQGPEVSLPNLVSSGSMYIVSREYVEKIGDKPFNTQPNGTGPFLLEDRRMGEWVRFGAHKGYWNTQPIPGTLPPARIDQVLYKVIPQEQTAVAALKAGEVDGVQSISSDMAQGLEKDGQLNVYYTNINSPLFLMMDRSRPVDEQGRPNPFSDGRVRRALNMAIDVDTIMKAYGTGHEVRTTMVGQGGIGYTPDVPFYKYDPAAARALLKQAGFENGFSTTLYTTADKPRFIEPMAQYLREAGVNIQYKISTPASILGRIFRKKLGGIAVWSGGRGRDNSATLMNVYLASDGVLALHPGDERVDGLIEKARQEFDVEKRAEIIKSLTRLIWEDAWFVPLWEGAAMKALGKGWEYENQKAVTSFSLPHVRKK